MAKRRGAAKTRRPAGDPVQDAGLFVPVLVSACDARGKCRHVRARGKVDTGAHDTLLGSPIVKALRPSTIGRETIRGVTGARTTARFGGVSLSFPDRKLRPVPLQKQRVLAYAAPHADYVLLGRKVMAGGDDPKAAMALSYDAAGARFSLTQARAVRGRRGTADQDEVRPLAKSPAQMTASEINKALDRLDKLSSKNTDAFIAAGRGHERPSDYWKKDDPLSREANAISDQRMALHHEIERRYGPGAPSRLPRGFGPLRTLGETDEQQPHRGTPKRSRERGLIKSQTLVDLGSLTAGVVGGVALNKKRPQGIDLPLVGNAPASAGLAVGSFAAALVARAAGWHKAKRAAVGVGIGATIATFAPRGA